MAGNRYHILYWLIMLFTAGCGNPRYYVIGNAPEYNIKKISKNSISVTVENNGIGKVTDFRIYTIDDSLQENDNFETLLPYAKNIYKHTQPKKNHKFVDEVKIEQLNDSIVVFQFIKPIIIHGYNTYLFHTKKRVFTFTAGYTGKF